MYLLFLLCFRIRYNYFFYRGSSMAAAPMLVTSHLQRSYLLTDRDGLGPRNRHGVAPSIDNRLYRTPTAGISIPLEY